MADDDDKKADDNADFVPMSQLQEIEAKLQATEEALSSVLDELCNTVPENMRNIIPNLPPAEKAKWLREAQQAGLFNPPAPTSSPDSKRPKAKTENLSGLSSVAMMARGYNIGPAGV